MKQRSVPLPSSNGGFQAILGLLPALGAVLLYTATAGFVPVPGESARTLYAYSGLDPFPQLLHPLWGLLVGAFSGFGQNSAFSVGVLCAILGALSIYLFFDIMAGCGIHYLRRGEAPDADAFCGLAASLYLLGSVPFWSVSTRAHPLALHIFLLMLTLWLLARFLRGGGAGSLALFAFALGIGLAEYPAMLLMGPPMAVIAVLHAVRRAKVPARQILLAGAAWLAGLGLFGYAARGYMRHPAQAYIGGVSATEALHAVVAASLQQVATVAGDIGWLLVAMFAVIPWILAFLAAQQTPVTEEPKGSLVVYGLLTILALVQLVPTTFTPFLAYQEMGVMIVAPYLFVAGYFGYAMAYWFSRIAIDTKRTHPQGRSPAWWFTLPLLLMLGVAAGLNYTWIDARPAAAVYRWTQYLSRALPDDAVLVSHGKMDELFALASLESDAPPLILNMARADDEPYRLQLATRIEDPRLKRLARTHLALFLREWLYENDHIDRFASLDVSATSWLRQEVSVLPHLALYRGIESTAGLARRRLLEDHRGFWADTIPDLKEARTRPDYIGRLAERLVQHSAKVANDFGVFMDELGDMGIALEAYQSALDMEPGNTSAMLNRYLLLARLGQTDESRRLWDRLHGPLSALAQPSAMELAIKRHGQLRNETWGTTMARVLAIPDRELLPADRFAAIAYAYASGQLSVASQLADELAREYPRSAQVGTLRGVFAYLLGNHDEMEQALATMDVANLDWSQLPHILGHFAAHNGEPDRAIRFWQRALSRRPADVLLLEDLVRLHLEQTDRDEEAQAEIARYVSRLLTLDAENPLANVASGFNHLEEDQLQAAADAFRRALRRDEAPHTQFLLARTLQQLGRHEEARSLVQRAIVRQPAQHDYRELLADLLDPETERLVAADLQQISDRPPPPHLAREPGVVSPPPVMSPEIEALLAGTLFPDTPAIEPEPEPPVPEPALADEPLPPAPPPEEERAVEEPITEEPAPAVPIEPEPDPLPAPPAEPAPTPIAAEPTPAPAPETKPPEATARPPLDW